MRRKPQLSDELGFSVWVVLKFPIIPAKAGIPKRLDAAPASPDPRLRVGDVKPSLEHHPDAAADIPARRRDDVLQHRGRIAHLFIGDIADIDE